MRSFVLGLALAVLASASAWACSQDPSRPVPSERDLYSRAKLVLLAHMTKVEERSPPDLDNGDAGLLVATVRPIEVFKGDPSPDLNVRGEIFLPGNCTLPFLAGADYLLFLDGADNVVTFADGSAVFMNIDSADAQEQIEAVRALQRQGP